MVPGLFLSADGGLEACSFEWLLDRFNMDHHFSDRSNVDHGRPAAVMGDDEF